MDINILWLQHKIRAENILTNHIFGLYLTETMCHDAFQVGYAAFISIESII